MTETGLPNDLCESLRMHRIVRNVEFRAVVTSSNTVLAASDADAGALLVTDHQSAGRGRRGRNWVAPPGSSLMFSLKYRLPESLAVSRWTVLPLVVGTALIDALTRHVNQAEGATVGLKWPNDVMVLRSDHPPAKVAGILVEAIGGSDPLAVIGVGINTDWRNVDPPEGVVATSLGEVTDSPVDRWEILKDVVAALDRHLGLLDSDPHGVLQRYIPHCVTLGRNVTAHSAPRVSGVATGLDPDGHLLIKTSDGTVVTVAAGDVEHLR